METGLMSIGLLLLACFGGLSLLAGGTLVFLYGRSRQKARLSQAWPATQGKVLEAFVHRREERDEDGDFYVTFFPVVRYVYTVNGEEYLGEQIAFGGVAGSSRMAQARRVVERYPEGEPVTVYYNPENPAEAVLERRGASPLLLVLGGVFLSFPLLMMCCVLGSLLMQR